MQRKAPGTPGALELGRGRACRGQRRQQRPLAHCRASAVWGQRGTGRTNGVGGSELIDLFLCRWESGELHRAVFKNKQCQLQKPIEQAQANGCPAVIEYIQLTDMSAPSFPAR